MTVARAFRAGRACAPLGLRAAAAVATLGLAGCAAHSVLVGECPTLQPSPAQATVSVQYLGVSGFLLKRGEDVILTAPLYSNPSLIEVGFDHAIRTDVALIDRLLPRDAAKASAILVGHSHYDHLLDVPYIARYKTELADVYGSQTTIRLLAAIERGIGGTSPPPYKVIPLEGSSGDHSTPGEWVPLGSGLRFMALRSRHSYQATLKLPFSDQQFPIHLWRGGQEYEAAEPPRSASDWREGAVFSFVIDFLDSDGRPAFRIYYQDSGTDEPIGYPPESLLAEKGVDLALLCVGGDRERLENHPAGILTRTKPRFVLLSHWEDFFVAQDAYLKSGGLDAAGKPIYDPRQRIYEIPPAHERKTPKFLKRVQSALPKGASAWVPCPTVSRFEFPLT